MIPVPPVSTVKGSKATVPCKLSVSKPPSPYKQNLYTHTKRLHNINILNHKNVEKFKEKICKQLDLAQAILRMVVKCHVKVSIPRGNSQK